MKRANEWCKNFTGLQTKTCKAGVEYDTVILGKGTALVSFPCFQDRNPQNAKCEKCVFRTPEEIAQAEADDAKMFEDMTKARSAIVQSCGGKWKRGDPGRQGKVNCPVCQGVDSLQYTRAGYNGHIHARCKTDGCVSWME